MPDRMCRLRGLFEPAGIDAFYVTNPENRYYLSGFSGSTGALLLTGDHAFLLTDFRYTAQASMECPAYQVIEVSGPYGETVFRILKQNSIFRLGLEGDHQTCNQYFNLKGICEGVEIKALTDMVEQLRTIKDQSEIELIEKAVIIADQAFEKILFLIKPGITESEIALQLEYEMRRMGAEGPAFKIIVASGVRSALPHGVASSKTIEEGDLVTMDFGAVYHGYHSDITRTLVIKDLNQRQKEIYKIVLEAQMNAIAAVKAGVRASDVDYAARSIIENKGYGECFGHSTGHGLGLSIHENPRLSANDDKILEPGMVVTVEPGIYIRNWGGVRIEDTVVVENNGCRVLTKTPKEKILILCL